MLEILWGLKTVAIFDVWTIEHVLSGISIGDKVIRHNRRKFNLLHIFERHHNVIIHFEVMGVLCLAFGWEMLEHYLEVGLAGTAVAYWFQGVEFWANRLISDPLMLVVGYFIARRFPILIWPARALSLAWLLVHVFAFPHSMYLHEIF